MGWQVLRMNMRGAGDSARICPRLYNAGLDTDLVAALDAVTRVAPRVAVIGFSLGANLALLALGRSARRLPAGLLGVVAVSPPLDLAACVAALERPTNHLYQAYFLRNLRLSYRYRQRLCPELYEAGRELGPRTIREWDEAITAPYGGYASADQYYARSSAGRTSRGPGCQLARSRRRMPSPASTTRSSTGSVHRSFRRYQNPSSVWRWPPTARRGGRKPSSITPAGRSSRSAPTPPSSRGRGGPRRAAAPRAPPS